MSTDNGFTFENDAAVSSAAELIMEQAPEVQQHAIDQHLQQQQDAIDNAEVDDAGTPFDAKIHTGTKLKDGTWRLKRVGGGSSVAKPRNKGKGKDLEQTTTPSTESQARAAGIVAASLCISLAKVYAKDYEPGDAMVTMQNEAWGNYFVATGRTDFPPGLALCFAVTSLAIAASTTEKGSERTKKIGGWLRARIIKWKVKRYLKKHDIKADVTIKDGEVLINGTRADLWDDGERKNDTSERTRR